MTNKELIELLRQYPENSTVYISYPSTDYWSSGQEAEIFEVIDENSYIQIKIN